MALQWIQGTVHARKIWSEGLFTLTVHCPGVEPFEAGQFLQVGLPLPEKHLHRPYSVASPHGESLEFFIVKVEGGELTPRLWNLECGASIDVAMKATGGFTLSHAPDAKNLWLLATGTGLAPYIAMLREGTLWKRYEKVVVVHGVRYLSDLAYVDELQNLTQQYPRRFDYVPVVSRESAWHGYQGRITQAIESGQLESLAQTTLDADSSAVMLCGNPQMLDDVEAILHARGMRKHKRSERGHYVVERYW